MTLLLVFAVAIPAHAQDGGPIRILVGFAPGGVSDVIARLIQDKMRDALDGTVIVENRPGANGAIAAEALKNAAPNGKTLMIAPIAVFVFAPLTQSNLRYDPLKDFAPVSLTANFRIVLTVGLGTPAKTLEEYIAWAKANRAKATYGVPLAGGPNHFFGVMLAQATGVDLAAVPYKGGAPLAIDLMGGQIPAGINVLSDVIKQHQSGKVRVLAISGLSARPSRRTSPPSVSGVSLRCRQAVGKRLSRPRRPHAKSLTEFPWRLRRPSNLPTSTISCLYSASSLSAVLLTSSPGAWLRTPRTGVRR